MSVTPGVRSRCSAASGESSNMPPGRTKGARRAGTARSSPTPGGAESSGAAPAAAGGESSRRARAARPSATAAAPSAARANSAAIAARSGAGRASRAGAVGPGRGVASGLRVAGPSAAELDRVLSRAGASASSARLRARNVLTSVERSTRRASTRFRLRTAAARAAPRSATWAPSSASRPSAADRRPRSDANSTRAASNSTRCASASLSDRRAAASTTASLRAAARSARASCSSALRAADSDSNASSSPAQPSGRLSHNQPPRPTLASSTSAATRARKLSSPSTTRAMARSDCGVCLAKPRYGRSAGGGGTTGSSVRPERATARADSTAGRITPAGSVRSPPGGRTQPRSPRSRLRARRRSARLTHRRRTTGRTPRRPARRARTRPRRAGPHPPCSGGTRACAGTSRRRSGSGCHRRNSGSGWPLTQPTQPLQSTSAPATTRTYVRYSGGVLARADHTIDLATDLATPLHEVTFCVVDLETTGGSPADCTITEVGAAKFRGGECLGTFQTLVNPGSPIPPFITQLTGITEAMVLPAPAVREILPALLEFVGGAVLVGHNVRFDLSFLDAALTSLDRERLGLASVDTVALARRLLLDDDVADCRLGTLAARFGLPHRPTHRALDDVLATADLLHLLLEQAAPLGVTELDDLLAPPAVARHPYAAKLRLTARLPRAPGVYLFRDGQGRPLLAGSARDLRTRVRSLFAVRAGPRLRTLGPVLRGAHRLDHVVCPTAFEAEVAATRVVHALEPRFNASAGRWRGYRYVRPVGGRPPRAAVARVLPSGGGGAAAGWLGP